MKLEDFIEELYKAGWKAPNDAQHTKIAALWNKLTLQPIETAPKDGTYIILFGDSGYTTTPLRASVGHYDPEYRPLNPWQTHSNDAFTDDGDEPIYWMPIPEEEKE